MVDKAAKRTPQELRTVLVHVRFIRYGRRRHSIFVADGRKAVSQFTHKLIERESQVPLKYATVPGWIQDWSADLSQRQELNLIVPVWLANELGFSYDSNYM